MSLPPPSPPSLPPPGGVPAAVPPEPGPPPRPWWKQWWVIAGAAVLALVGIGAIAALTAGDDNDDSSVATETVPAAPGTSEPEPSTTPETVPASTAPEDTVAESTAPETSAAPETSEPEDTVAESTVPETTAPAERADPGIGDTIRFDDGGSARVYSVTPNAPPRLEVFPPDPGFTYTEAEVEQCAGSSGTSVNPLYWKAFLADNTEADVSILSNDMQTFDMAPGACTKGWVAFSVPDGGAVADVVLTSELFSEIGRWSAATTMPIAAPLVSETQVSAVALGETVGLDGGGTAVVRSITSNAPPTTEFLPPDPGRQFVDVDVEVCAGTEPLSVNPLYWLMTAQDNYTGGASLGGGTLSTIDVAAGQCVAGIVQMDMLEQSVPAYVIFTGDIFEELARWSGG